MRELTSMWRKLSSATHAFGIQQRPRSAVGLQCRLRRWRQPQRDRVMLWTPQVDGSDRSVIAARNGPPPRRPSPARRVTTEQRADSLGGEPALCITKSVRGKQISVSREGLHRTHTGQNASVTVLCPSSKFNPSQPSCSSFNMQNANCTSVPDWRSALSSSCLLFSCHLDQFLSCQAQNIRPCSGLRA